MFFLGSWLDGDGKDSGKLTLTTGTLSASDIKDSAKSRDISVGVSASINNVTDSVRARGAGGTASGVAKRSANIPVLDGSFASSSFKQDSKATIGQGTLNVGVPNSAVTINRDITQSQVVTKDRQTGFTLYADVAAAKELVSLVKGVAGNKDAAKNSVILQGAKAIANDPLRIAKDVVGEAKAITDRDKTTESQTGELVRLVALKLGLEASGAQLDDALQVELARAKPQLDEAGALRDAATARADAARASGDLEGEKAALAEVKAAQGVINTITEGAVASGLSKVSIRLKPGAPQSVSIGSLTKGSDLVKRDGSLVAGTDIPGAPPPLAEGAEIVVIGFKDGQGPTLGRFVVDTSVKTKAFVDSLNPTLASLTKNGIRAAATGGTAPLLDFAVEQGAGIVIPKLPNVILDPLTNASSAVTTFLGDGGTALLVGPSGNLVGDFSTIRNDQSNATRTDSGGVSFLTGIVIGSAVTTIGATAKVVLKKRGGADVPALDPTNPRPGAANSPNTDGEAGDPSGFTNGRGSLVDYEKISTAKPGQATKPRDLNEQVLFNQVLENPAAGQRLGLNNDPRFKASDGFIKMQANQKLPNGQNITIHYQYNSITGKAYDIKFTTPKRVPPPLQPGPSIRN